MTLHQGWKYIEKSSDKFMQLVNCTRGRVRKVGTTLSRLLSINPKEENKLLLLAIRWPATIVIALLSSRTGKRNKSLLEKKSTIGKSSRRRRSTRIKSRKKQKKLNQISRLKMISNKTQRNKKSMNKTMTQHSNLKKLNPQPTVWAIWYLLPVTWSTCPHTPTFAPVTITSA